MDTIISYLNNMFATLPKSDQMLKLKQDLLASMEEKYYELKMDGKSENEAVGIVISEFGNIDELTSELGIMPEVKEEWSPMLADDEVEGFMAAKRKSGLWIGIGVALVLTGVALLIFITTSFEIGMLGGSFSEDAANMFGLIAMLLFIVPAIAMFIYSGMKLEKYKYLKSEFTLPYHLKAYVQQKQEAFASTYTLSLIMGVCLCVISPAAIFVGSAFSEAAASLGVVVLLEIVAVAVFLFVYYGNIKDSFSFLLQTGDYSKAKKEEDRVIGGVAAIIWPLATCIFLISGLVFQQWHINWIVFPITAILFGMFSGAYNIFKSKGRS
ncbi:permease prefix domain 1-containing protein [Paenibacillus sp. NPDC058177]|uniref:permease prefix domain 1-containing protein n=1 Tax=Paenibacillus sp. NPDC058177 TaxID=3346369 RepID=UPI0036D8DFD3